MTPWIGLGLGGASYSHRRQDGGAAEDVFVGRPAWGPAGLLRDLELRLGLAATTLMPSTRLPRWAARMKAIANEDVFCTKSFIADEVGTAQALLAWRDDLVLAGWDGTPIPNGGERLAVMAQLEASTIGGPVVGDADRLAYVEREIERQPQRPYDAMNFIEPPSVWPWRWQRVFDRLAKAGVQVSVDGGDRCDGRAAPSTDLGLLQARLRGERAVGEPRGDGTLLFVTSDTSIELAEHVASMLARSNAAGCETVVVRSLDRSTLDAALARQGLASQGSAEESSWRPATQVLPLAIELAFHPLDPHRVLDLLTVPRGPFRGVLGARLARAVARQPGVGGQEWVRQREHAMDVLREWRLVELLATGVPQSDAERAVDELVTERRRTLESWLEESRDPHEVATKSELLTSVERVRSWIDRGLKAGDVEAFAPAHALLTSFIEALAAEPRETFSREEARRLVDHFGRADVRCDLSVESAGRIAHVVHPSALFAPADEVYFWSFLAGLENRPPRSPWNAEELAALAAAGVVWADPSVLLRVDMDIWRRAILAARSRVVFAVPRTVRGRAAAPHPLWDEIRARLGMDDRAIARITCESRVVLDGRASVDRVSVVDLGRSPLPEGRGAWSVAHETLGQTDSGANVSVTALETIATCPLAWVLEHRARIRSGATTRIASGPLLNGGLAHRLVETLHVEGSFELAEDAFVASASRELDALIACEGATLLLPGASIERLQLTRQLLRGMRELHRYLRRSGYRIAAVEEVVSTTSAIGALEGRLDLRLADPCGNASVLDLKWGASSHKKRLEQGAAVQLAIYARALGGAPAAYFAIASGEVLATDPRMHPRRAIDGPTLDETWSRAERTARAVLASHERGRVFVAAAKHSLPLLEAIGVRENERDAYYDAAPDARCEHCDYDALCGRRWERYA